MWRRPRLPRPTPLPSWAAHPTAPPTCPSTEHPRSSHASRGLQHGGAALAARVSVCAQGVHACGGNQPWTAAFSATFFPPDHPRTFLSFYTCYTRIAVDILLVSAAIM
jgi:hypothetical protein